jgi:erythronate-4-phosphate dehydrogenase
MNMIRIFADDKIPFLKGVLEPHVEVGYLPGRMMSNPLLKKADALLIRTRTKCNEKLLKETPVKFIGTATIGFDHIDAQYCEKNNIVWTNAPGCNSSSVAQYVTAAMLKLSREHKYKLKNKTIGIIGVGNVGKKVEKICRLFGMKVLLNDPPRARIEGDKNFVSLDEILSESDIITLHVPLHHVGEDKTYHLFDEESFKKIKKRVWFINSSRGEVSDTAALKKSLESGKLRGVVLDVWENEPDIDFKLLSKTFIATPHIAGYSIDGKANGTAMVVNSLCRYFNLPLKNWYPGNVPSPDVPDIFIDCKGKSDEKILFQAVSHTYNIEVDDNNFRFNASDFESLRGDYPFRREFGAYTVNLRNGNSNIHGILEGMGFIVK